MLGPFSIDTYLPAFPAIGANLHATQVEVQLTLTAYMAMFSFMTLWHGSLSDALGRRSVILAGLGCYVFVLGKFGLTSDAAICRIIAGSRGWPNHRSRPIARAILPAIINAR